MRRDEQLVATLLAHKANANVRLQAWTPERRSSEDFNFAPALVGATPFWLAARFDEPGIMRALVEHGADPLFVHRVEYFQTDINDRRTGATTALLAATGIGGGRAWVQIPPAEREARMLATVKLAIELGIDVNAANTDGRTALDAAQALKYESVVKYLIDRGGKNGAKPATQRPATR
jgi:ankyrin repeat protein